MRGVTHGAHIKAVDAVPKVEVLGAQLVGVDEGRESQRRVAGDHEAGVGVEVVITRPEHGVEHALVEEAVAHPLADDDVDAGQGEVDVFDAAAEAGDAVLEAVGVHDDACLVDDGGVVDGEDVAGAGTGAEEGEDACAAAEVEDGFVGEEVLVVVDEVAVGVGADGVFEHGFVDGVGGVRGEVAGVLVGLGGGDGWWCVFRLAGVGAVFDLGELVLEGDLDFFAVGGELDLELGQALAQLLDFLFAVVGGGFGAQSRFVNVVQAVEYGVVFQAWF